MKPSDHLSEVGQRFPSAWKLVNKFRRCAYINPEWPEWCFMPIEGWYAIVAHKYGVSSLSIDKIREASQLAAIGAWRYTQGIYHFNKTTYETILHTPNDQLTISHFYNLPEWSIYVETPDFTWGEYSLHGFWCHLEWNKKKNFNEIRVLLNAHRLINIALPLNNKTINEMKHYKASTPHFMSNITSLHSLYKVWALVSCLCCQDIQITSPRGNFSGKPQPKRYKNEWRLFPPQKPRVWSVYKG